MPYDNYRVLGTLGTFYPRTEIDLFHHGKSGCPERTPEEESKTCQVSWMPADAIASYKSEKVAGTNTSYEVSACHSMKTLSSSFQL